MHHTQPLRQSGTWQGSFCLGSMLALHALRPKPGLDSPASSTPAEHQSQHLRHRRALCSASSCTAELKYSAARSHTPMAFLLLIPKGGRYPLVLNLDRVANWWSPVELHKDPPVNLIKASGLKGLVSRDLFRSLIGPRTPQSCELVIQTHQQGKPHHERPELPVKQSLP